MTREKKQARGGGGGGGGFARNTLSETKIQNLHP